MRRFRRLVGLLWLATLVVACDTVQPLLIGTQVVAVSFTATNALVPTYLVWDMFEDSNPVDGQPDDVDSDGQPDMFVWCQTPSPNDQTPSLNPNSVPLGFGIEVAIIRAGTTREEVLTGEAALMLNANRTPYDTSVSTVFTFAKAPISVMDMGMTRNFMFLNPRRHTAAHRDVASATSNPLSDLDPMTYGLGSGLCSTGDPGPVSIDGGPNPITFDLGKGDTLIVRARRGNLPPELTGVVSTQPQVSAKTTVDGRPVSAGGNTTSQVGSELRFTLTTR